jgi:1,4-dihydroxy-2-naphthoate octaprenyltransferase
MCDEIGLNRRRVGRASVAVNGLPDIIDRGEARYVTEVGPWLFRFRQVGAFVRLGRPLFLTGGFVLYALGAAVALHPIGGDAGARVAIDWSRFAWGQLAITATQLMTHYCNDYFDFAADQANATPTRWSGGSRVLPAGELPRRVALIAALVLCAIALGATAVSVVHAGAPPLAAALLVMAVALSWAYSAPPMRLHSRGLGELDAALVVSGLTPLIAFTLQSGRLAWLPLLVVTPLCCLQFAMLLAIEFPDAAGDAAAGKHTLVVRHGAPWAARAYQASLLAVYLPLPLLAHAGLPRAAAAAVLLTAPIAGWQLSRMRRGDWRDPARWESLAFWSVALLILTSAAELVAFIGLGRA